MKTNRLILLPLLACLASFASAQGPLSPPGSPAPTMKTLDQIEARTPIAASGFFSVPGPFITLSQPGSYYLTGNITVTTSDAIVISASNVTLDLNGFTVSGNGAMSSPSSCIRINDYHHLTIKNGNLSNMGRGIVILGTATNSYGHRIERVNLTSISTYGIFVSNVSDGTVIDSCNFSRIGNTTTGLTPEAIRDAGGIRVDHCIISDVTSIVALDPASGISGANSSFYINNTISNCKTGIFRGRIQTASEYLEEDSFRLVGCMV